jgi:separase
LTQTLDTLFVLARTTLDVKNPRTYGPAYDFLGEAVTLMNFETADSSLLESERPKRANLTRCVSGAFHNIAGALYQEARYGAAVRFLKESCELGERALHSYTGKAEKREEVWVVLEQQLYRRWELLGVCYTKIGERKVCRIFLFATMLQPFISANSLHSLPSLDRWLRSLSLNSRRKH